MGTASTYRVHSTRPAEFWHSIKVTGAADVDADGFTINEDPGNVVESVEKGSGEGDITITLAQGWAGCANALVTSSIDKSTFTFDSEDVDGSTPTVKIASFVDDTAADQDSGVLRISLLLRSQ